MSQNPTPTQETTEHTRKINVPKLILAGILLVVALMFIFSNLSKATVSFLGASLTMPGWVWFLAILALGIIVGSLFPWLRPRKNSHKKNN